MAAGERQRLGQVGLALGAAGRPRVATSTATEPVNPRPASDASSGPHGWVPRPGTRCSSRPSPVPSPRCTWARPPPIVSAISSASPRAAAQCDRSSVYALEAGHRRVPARRVRHELPPAHPHRVHVLDRESARSGSVSRSRAEAGGEVAGVLALPGERRVHHDGRRAELGGERGAAAQPLARSRAPHPLGDQQAGRVHRQDRHP